MKRKVFTGFIAAAMSATLLMTSCASTNNTAATQQSESPSEVAMQYVSKEDLKADIDAGGKGYIVLDVRKAADYNESHIKGAFSGDVDSSISATDDATSTANLKAALNASTGSESGNSDSKFVLVCYSGKKYAQAATNLLVGMGIPAANVYTLEGGNNGWKEGGNDFTSLMEAVVATQYIAKEDLKADIEAGGNGYVILDVRKAADYSEAHIKGAFSGDVDSSISATDDATSTANLKAALNASTGSENGNSDSKFVLVCYSGKRYAAAATDLLIGIGIPAGNIYTLEGGNNGWKDGGNDYTSLME